MLKFLRNTLFLSEYNISFYLLKRFGCNDQNIPSLLIKQMDTKLFKILQQGDNQEQFPIL